MSVALLDANVLIALIDPEHQHHDAAHGWLSQLAVSGVGQHANSGFAVCPLVENACLRIMCQPSYPKSLPFDLVRSRLHSLRLHGACHFWPDSISLTAPTCLVPGAMLAPAAVTETYLLALAVENAGRLVTFDRRIAWQNVIGASAESLWVLR